MKKIVFRATAAINQQRRLTIMANLKMVCSYGYSCLDLPLGLVDCHIKGCESRLHHVCQEVYVAMHDIDIDGAERSICHNCVDKFWM